MKSRSVSVRRCFVAWIVSPALAFMFAASCWADNRTREDSWEESRDDVTGTLIMTRELTLHPKAETKPALKHRFLPDEFELLDGNAALYYLKAMGFIEQNAAREKLNELFRKGRDQAQAKDTPIHATPPYSYLNTPPDQLPIPEVKEYLALTGFQTGYLEEARNLRSFSSDRNLRLKENPIGYLLPEVQMMRELARTQSVRCRLAIAENRIDDAIQTLGQQIAMARHLGNDDFYVSALVGIAIHSISWNDALYLIQKPDTPNLYWAYASLPSPLIDLRKSGAYERQFLFEQIKCLREVHSDPKPVAYWQSFVDRFAQQANGVEIRSFKFSNNIEANRMNAVAFIAAAYPSALRYLAEVEGMDSSKLEAYPTAQVVFLAAVRFYERIRDDYFKWDHVPLAIAMQGIQKEEARIREEKERVGFAGELVETFLPALGAIRSAQGRMQQRIALIQTMEAIRMYAAKNNGKLPSSLSETPLPCPNDPLTDKSFSYEWNSATAVLTSSTANHLRYRFVLRMAE